MSAIAPITINDGQATPVSHIFNPIASGLKSVWREAIVSLALIGQGLITLAVKMDTGSGLNKVVVTTELPALEVSTGQNSAGYTAAPKVGYVNKAVTTYFLPSRGNAQQRKDLRVLHNNACSNAQIVDAVENLAIPY